MDREGERYMQRVYDSLKDVPLLTAAEEKQLAKKIQTGNKKEREAAVRELVNRNVLLIFEAIKKYKYRRVSEDYLTVGMLGLERAAVKYDGRGRFSTYALLWVRSYFRNYSLEEKATIVNKAVLSRLSRLDSKEQQLIQVLNSPKIIGAAQTDEDRTGFDIPDWDTQATGQVETADLIEDIREFVVSGWGDLWWQVILLRAEGDTTWPEIAKQLYDGELSVRTVTSIWSLKHAEILKAIRKEFGSTIFFD